MSIPFPEVLLRSLSKLDHFDLPAFSAAHVSEPPWVSVHMNPGKPILQDGFWPEQWKEPPFHISGKVPWASDAWYLDSRPSFTLDPLFHAGTYYVQEASGLFLAFAFHQIAHPSKKLRVLDLCAAPGGKSTLLQSLISPESLLLSNEVIKTRVPALYQNMTKWGRANGMVTHNDPAHFKKLPGFFDLILIDAPCSGSGLFRKDPEAAAKWSPELVNLCSQRQQRIVQDVWGALKDDGMLIYSTCSYSKEENEDVLDWIFQQFDCSSLSLNPDPAWHIVETHSEQAGASGYRFYPDKIPGEGFFLSVIQKKGPSGSRTKLTDLRSHKVNRNLVRISKMEEKQLSNWVRHDSVHYLPVGDAIHGIQQDLVNDFGLIKDVLYLKKAGIRLGKAGENDWIPDHELALADILNDQCGSLDLEKRDALEFLRGNTFDLPSVEKGWRLVRYKGYGLGWVKILDKRINNYYPKSWRIRL